MKMLVVNAGSSSVKFTVFDSSWIDKQEVIVKGQVECIGLPQSYLIYEKSGKPRTKNNIKSENDSYIDHNEALNCICKKLLDPTDGVLKRIEDIIAIGHRVVHGGEKITQPVIIDRHVKKIIKDYFNLAPLHNPPNLAGIEACEKIFPNIPNVAIFDTAFHQTMPPEAYLYAIPYELYQKHGIRKYGFHGTSHHYVAKTTANFLKVRLEDLKLITCHLGNGDSMAAIAGGKVIDTSMGLTPLEGLVMGTRSGDLDPAVVLRLIEMGMTTNEVDNLLNKKSGLLGLAGINTGDMRDIVQAAEKGNKQAELALKLFIHRVVKYIGAYHAILGGADAVIFTAGIGENSSYIREKILEKLTGLDIVLDKKNNKTCKAEHPVIISMPESKVKAIVVPTNEELMIATQTIELLVKENKLKLVAAP